MAIVDEIRSSVMNSLYAFDFSTAFPGGYTGAKSVVVMRGYPYDLIDNMLAENDGQMQRPIITVHDHDVVDIHRSLGNVSNVNAPGGKTRYATRVEASFLIGCWADQRLGGADTAELLGGLVIGWAFLNQASLAAYRQLRTFSSQGGFRDRAQVWRYDVTLMGNALLTYDA